MLPGIALTAGIALAAFGFTTWASTPYLNPIVVSLVGGALFHYLVKSSSTVKPGIKISIRTLMRIGIALIGLQISVADIMGIGVKGLFAITFIVASTMIFTVVTGKLLRVGSGLTYLLASGTSICGASAILATAATVRARDEDIGYAIVSITVFGTASILFYPVLQIYLSLSDQGFGFWVGASIHEVAQVAAAAFQNGQSSGEFGVITKLARVLLLAPVVFAIALAFGKASSDAAPVPFPWFILGFACFAILGNTVDISAAVLTSTALLTKFFFCMALAGIGLDLNISSILQFGIRPLLLGLFSWIYISAISLLVALNI